MMSSKELAIKQIKKAGENIYLAYKLLDYPEEICDYLEAVDKSFDDLAYGIKCLKIHEPEAEEPTDRQIDEMILRKLEEKDK